MLPNVYAKTWHRGEDPSWLLNCLTDVERFGENYKSDTEYGLQKFIENGIMDSYTILYRDDVIVSGMGTRPDAMIDGLTSCYQIAVRGFRVAQQGLRQDYFSLNMIIPNQVARGRELGFKNIFMSFNLDKSRLIDNLDRAWEYPREKQGPLIVNGISQWIYLF